MLRLIKNLFAAGKQQAVIITPHFKSSEEFGTKVEQQAVYNLEDAIEKILPSGSYVDGHEFGGGHANIYLYGPEADLIFQSIEDMLKSADFRTIKVALRYGSVYNPKAFIKNVEIMPKIR